jgi:coenzyme PQQ precursor peptide PqqA
LRDVGRGPRFDFGVEFAPNCLSHDVPIIWQNPWEDRMAWKTPKIVEVPVGMEINMYACAARK